MIPKKLHYIWFGAKTKPAHVLDTIESWKRRMPDYEIIEWNETNFDITQHPWMKRMHEEKQFAFASDWARLKILEQHGGIYLDIDVEIMKPLDRFLQHRMFWGFEYECYLATCIIGSEPQHPVITQILLKYDSQEKEVINNKFVTEFFLETFESFRLNGSLQTLAGDVHIYPKEYFSVPTHDPHSGYTRHHATNLWRLKPSNSLLKRVVRKLIGEVLYFKLVACKINRTHEFRDIYRAHRE